MKQKFLFSLRAVTMFLVMCLSIGNVWGDTTKSFSIVFNDNGSDGSTALTTSTFKNQISTNKDSVKSVSATSYCYPGTGGIKISSSNNNGSFTLVLNRKFNITKVVLSVKNKNATTNGVTVGSTAFSTTDEWNTSSFSDLNFTGTTTETDQIKIEIGGTAKSKRVGYLASMTIYYSVSGGDTPTAPEITTQPTGATYDQGAVATALTIAASGNPTPTYQWYSNTTDEKTVDDAHKIDGATSASYTPSTSTTGDTYYYCVATNSEGSATSNTAKVTVNAVTLYTVTFDAGSGSCATSSLTQTSKGASITLPTATITTQGWSFSGWCVEKVSTKTTSKPTLLTGTYTPTGDITLYAVYECVEGGGGGYYLSMTSGSTTYYMGTANEKSLKAETNIASATEFYWEDGYLYYMVDKAPYYVSHKKSKEGTIAFSSLKSEAQAWNITEENSTIKFNSTAQDTRYLIYYSGGGVFDARTTATTLNKEQAGTKYYASTVVVKTLSSIEFGGSLTKATYTEGETFDPAGITVLATYVGQADKEDVTTKATLTYSTDPLAVGTTKVNVAASFGNKEVNKDYNITVNAASTYEITASAAEGGSYTVKVGDADAVDVPAEGAKYASQANKTITMTSTAGTGYKLASTPFVVKDADDASVSISKSGDNYTFTMPAKSVTIIAQYSAVYTISAASGIEHGTISFTDKDDNAITETSQGSKVKVVVNPTTGYELATLYYVKAGVVNQNDIKENKYFSMPAGNVTVTATFSPIVATGVSISGDNTVKEGKTITLTATVEPTGALVSNPEWKSSDETVATVDATGKVMGVKAGNVNITYEFTNAESTKITSANHAIEVKESVVMNFEEITNATSLNAGDVVLFVKSDGTQANGNINDSKYMPTVNITSITAVEEDVFPMTLGGNSTDGWTFSNGNGGYLACGSGNNSLSWTGDYNTWTIAATSTNCTITNKADLTSKFLKYNGRFSNYASTSGGTSWFKLYRKVVSSTVNVVSADDTKGSVALYDEEFDVKQTIGAKYAQGTKLGLDATAEDGYEFASWTLSADNGGASVDDATSAMAVLTVGGKAVTATANFGLKNYDIKLTQPQTSSKVQIATISAKVDGEEVSKACAGTHVTLSYDPESVIEGYEFTEWTVFNTSTLDELEVTDNVFEMIGANVTVEAVFTEKAKYTVTVASEDDNKGVVGFEDESGSAVVFYKDATPTIYAIAEEGYAFTNWTLNDGAKTTIADATSAETTITVKDAAIITAHFEAAAAKTLTWYVNGTTTSGLKTVGSNITFSAPTSGIPTGYVFKGWSEVEVAQTQTKPAYVTSATMPNADKTYYAVMAKETKGQNTYTKLTNGSFDTNAKYAIGADYQASQYDPVVQYFFNDYGGTLDTEISWGGCCTASGTPLEFTLSGSASQLVVKTGNVYFVAAGNKAIKMSSSSSTIVLSSSGTILTKSTSGNTLFYNHNQGNGGIRWYTSGSTQNAYFYKITPGTITYSDYCTFVKAVASVIISGEPTKTTYGVGDVFDKAGIVVKAKYNDNSETTITTDPEIEWNIQPATFTAKGENVEVSVKVTYKSIESETKNYYVTVSKKTLTLTFYEGLEDITQKQVYHDADAFKLFVETPNDYNGDLSFESSETSIATVAQEYDGWYVTPIAAGQTIITVTGEETDTYNSGTATLKVIVVQHLLDPTFAFSKSSVTANLGEAFTAPTLSKSSDLTVANISWNSSKESVATVDNAGVVTIVGLGTTTITASFSGDSKYNAAETQYTLKVNDPNADVITATFLGASTKEYAVFDEVTSTKNNITYNGSCMKNKDGDIQIKKGSTGGIVVSSSNKIATRIELTFGSTYGNNVEVYGKNTPYTDHSDLQSDDARGTLLYTFVESDDPVVFELPKGYMYIAFQSANKAAYIQQISISWKEPTDNRPNLTNTIGTICLENNVKRGEYAGASFYEVDYVEYQGETPYKVHFAEVEQLEAGYPYIYAKDDDANTIYWVEGTATNTAQSKNGLVGTLEDITGWDADGNNTLSTGNKYLVKGNLFCECGVWCGLNANRAYLDLNLPNIPTQGQSQNVAKRKLVLTREQAQTPTDVVNVNANENANVIRKVIIDNQMFIIRGGKMYNASGAIVK